MTLKIAISSCPNDTFAFDAIINNKIDLCGYNFDFILEDIEQLNKRALNKETDITKISFYAYSSLTDDYEILNSGNALCMKTGPLLISKNKYKKNDIENLRIAIPGKHTTAFLMLKSLFPNVSKIEEMHFSEIENSTLNSKVDAGVIIHENRFTYQNKGLLKLADFGEYWYEKYQLPIPLGGIIIKKNLGQKVIDDINKIVRNSIEFAFANPYSSKAFVKHYAQEIDDDVIKQHIELYVNNYTLELDINARNSINILINKANQTVNR